MRSVDEHLAACLALAEPPRATEVGLEDLLDAVLAEDVASAVELPPFDNSSMDGYAVRVGDLAPPGSQSVSLPVSADLPAGVVDVAALAPGTAARIMTGAPLPPGAEAVVPVEWTDAGRDVVQVRQPPGRVVAPGQFVRRAGSDVRRGDVLLRAGTRLSPRHVALLAAIGRRQARVVPRPRVVVVSTGAELAEPGTRLGPGQVYESNAFGLVAGARELGAGAVRVAPVGDDPVALARTLVAAAAGADLILTSGGVSAGAYEPVRQAFEAGHSPGTVEFVKVAMQPGMPQGLGHVVAADGRSVPLVALPGNPVSSLVSFEVFVRPMLRRMLGEAEADWQRPFVEATATAGWDSPAGKRQFTRARIGGDPAAPQVTPVGGAGSHLTAALATATCLAVVPEGLTRVAAGDTLRCMTLGRIPR